jgi:ABC-type antimicrobial peptide transport system permease subunit
LYGLTAYSVSRRTSEIGVRMAFGASRGNVLGLVMRRAFVQVALGAAIGIPVARLGAHAIASQLYGVKGYDLLSLCLAVLVLATSAALAAFIPARRAASIEPMQALRSE